MLAGVGEEFERQPVCLVQLPEEFAGLERILGNQVSVLVVKQIGILMLEAQDRGRFGRNHGVALANGIGQQSHILAAIFLAPFRSPDVIRAMPLAD